VPYSVVTDAAAQALSIPTGGMVEGTESYDDAPPTRVHVLVLNESKESTSPD
jgi:hypothetical protein